MSITSRQSYDRLAAELAAELHGDQAVSETATPVIRRHGRWLYEVHLEYSHTGSWIGTEDSGGALVLGRWWARWKARRRLRAHAREQARR